MNDPTSKPEMLIKDLASRWRGGVKGSGMTAAIITAAVIIAIGLVIASKTSSAGWFNEPAQAQSSHPPSLLTPEAIVEKHEEIRFRAQLRLTISRLYEMMARAEELNTDILGLDVLIDQMQQLYDSLDPQKRDLS